MPKLHPQPGPQGTCIVFTSSQYSSSQIEQLHSQPAFRTRMEGCKSDTYQVDRTLITAHQIWRQQGNDQLVAETLRYFWPSDTIYLKPSGCFTASNSQAAKSLSFTSDVLKCPCLLPSPSHLDSRSYCCYGLTNLRHSMPKPGYQRC